MKTLFTLLFLSTASFLFAQDTIVFTKIKNPQKVIKIPVNKFDVEIKTFNREKINAYITDVRDSVCFLKVYSIDKQNKKQKRRELKHIYRDTSLTYKQKDSLEKAIEYSDEYRISLNEIQCTSISIFNIKEMKWKVKVMQYTLDAYLAGYLILLFTFAPVPIVVGTAISGTLYVVYVFSHIYTPFDLRKWRMEKQSINDMK